MRKTAPALILLTATFVSHGCQPSSSRETPLERARRLVVDLQDSNPDKSGKAGLELIRMGEPAVPALVELLQNPDSHRRGLALSTLWALGPKARAAVPGVAQELGDDDPSLRESAARTLESIGPGAAEAVPALIKALDDTSRPVRQAAVKALGAIGPAASAAVPVLTQTLRRGGSWPEAEEALLKIQGRAPKGAPSS